MPVAPMLPTPPCKDLLLASKNALNEKRRKEKPRPAYSIEKLQLELEHWPPMRRIMLS